MHKDVADLEYNDAMSFQKSAEEASQIDFQQVDGKENTRNEMLENLNLFKEKMADY